MPHKLVIETVINGWIVQAGCQTLAFSKRAEIVEEFAKWVDDPMGQEKKYRELMEKRGFHPIPIPANVPSPPPQNYAAEAPAAREMTGQEMARSLVDRRP